MNLCNSVVFNWRGFMTISVFCPVILLMCLFKGGSTVLVNNWLGRPFKHFRSLSNYYLKFFPEGCPCIYPRKSRNQQFPGNNSSDLLSCRISEHCCNHFQSNPLSCSTALPSSTILSATSWICTYLLANLK